MALVTVLAVLTVMALLAMGFTVLLMIELESSRSSQGRVQSDMMAQSGVEHAISLLRQDIAEQAGWDNRGDPREHSATPAGERKWRVVRGANGTILGRYTFEIEDESGKIHINAAAATSAKEQNQGIGTFEILLSDGRDRGLPIASETARHIVQYRYGPDGMPGRAGIDDNLTASRYQNDEIDNDANGIVDEPGEGVDEPEEYQPSTPRGDDRVFMTVTEMLGAGVSPLQLDEQRRLAIKRLATLASHTRDTFLDDRTGTQQNRVNINVADRFQLMDVLTRANTDGQFEPASRDLNQLGANIQDYRDENHVLTTVGNEYGVEAVSFNEVLAYDASFGYVANRVAAGEADDDYTHILNYWFFYYYRCASGPAFRWRIVNFSKSSLTMGLPDNVTDNNMPYFLKCDLPWKHDFWKNAEVAIYTNTTQFYTCKATGNPGSSSRTLSIQGMTDRQFVDTPANAKATVYTGWNLGYGPWCHDPGRTETYFVHPRKNYPKNYYYQIHIQADYHDFSDPSLTEWGGGGTTAAFKCPRDLDVDGDPTKHSASLPVHGKYIYMNGKAQRPNAAGYFPITLTSSLMCKNNNPNNRSDFFFYDNFRGNVIWKHILVRPDIVELKNISGKPITLRNWAIVVNTGKDAWDLARIDSSRRFSTRYGAQFDDPNPTIPSNGYFYLTNNREIFSREHASGNSQYGGNVNESIPVYNIPQEGWGIMYKVVKTDFHWIKVEGSDWTKDQMANEQIECVITRKPPGSITADGHVFSVIGNTKNTLLMPGSGVCGFIIKGDFVRIMGLPRQGGFVSFTLKNEYNQVVARTLEYGSVELDKFGYSTQKYDPTHYTWVPTASPTMGGTDRLAQNMKAPVATHVQPHIKNNRYASSVELLKVRKSKDWENLGSLNAGATRRALQAIDKYVTVGGIRLDAEEEGAHIRGWNPAFGAVAQCARGNVTIGDVQWAPGTWGNSRLRVTSGPSAGEEFIVTNNSASSLKIVGYSTATHRPPNMQQGDLVSVGPGYGTSFYYTRLDNDEGEWEWKNKEIQPAVYGLYLFGLNDSINTTEFLEENWNAEIEALIYNFRTRAHDALPLENKRAGAFYAPRSMRNRLRYTKSDGVFCGVIGPDHVSPYQGIKLKLVSHSTGQQMCSGFAWFDYAYLAPGATAGKLNVNTADQRVLAALPGITTNLAANIARGIPASDGRPLKPYRQNADLLDVRGITPELYGPICNLITVRSDYYRVKVIGQSIIDSDGVFDPATGDKVVGESRLDLMLDRSDLSSSHDQAGMFRRSVAR